MHLTKKRRLAFKKPLKNWILFPKARETSEEIPTPGDRYSSEVPLYPFSELVLTLRSLAEDGFQQLGVHTGIRIEVKVQGFRFLSRRPG